MGFTQWDLSDTSDKTWKAYTPQSHCDGDELCGVILTTAVIKEEASGTTIKSRNGGR